MNRIGEPMAELNSVQKAAAAICKMRGIEYKGIDNKAQPTRKDRLRVLALNQIQDSVVEKLIENGDVKLSIYGHTRITDSRDPGKWSK